MRENTVLFIDRVHYGNPLFTVFLNIYALYVISDFLELEGQWRLNVFVIVSSLKR